MRTANEGALGDQGYSNTAATVGNKLYPDSGLMTYRVTLATGTGNMSVDVDADTGDKAATMALEVHNGCKVVHVAPAPQKIAA